MPRNSQPLAPFLSSTTNTYANLSKKTEVRATVLGQEFFSFKEVVMLEERLVQHDNRTIHTSPQKLRPQIPRRALTGRDLGLFRRFPEAFLFLFRSWVMLLITEINHYYLKKKISITAYLHSKIVFLMIQWDMWWIMYLFCTCGSSLTAPDSPYLTKIMLESNSYSKITILPINVCVWNWLALRVDPS